MDEFGRLLPLDGGWVRIGVCRCDDTSIAEVTDATGRVFRPRYKVVAHRADIKVGERIRVENEDGTIRGEGVVSNVTKTNYLDYMTIYL